MNNPRAARWQRLHLLHQGSIKSTKGDRRAMQILENATSLIAKNGYEALRFQELADKCKIARPLIHHYFPDKETLLLSVVQYVATEHQMFLLEQIPGDVEPDKILDHYVRANLIWPARKVTHAQVWMNYLALAAYSARDKLENTASVNHGWARIFEILQLGARKNIWKDSCLREKSRLIQTLVTGAVISLITEERTPGEREEFIRLTQNETSRILGTEFV